MRRALLVLLSLAACAAQTSHNESDDYIPAPYFDQGENLSSKNCGMTTDANKWDVFVQNIRTHIQCDSFIVISQRTVLGNGLCHFSKKNITTDLRVFPKYCDYRTTEEECITASVRVLDVIDIAINPTADLNFKIMITENMTSEVLSPICLFNRDNLMDLQSQRESPYFLWKPWNAFPSEQKNVKGQSNCNTVLNNYELEYLKYNKIPMQNILCVEESRFYYNYLINFYNGRYFLRGLRHIWDYRVYIDILPYIDEITRHAKDVYALRPIPQTKQPKGYDTPYNFSFPACGWKMTLTRTRRYGGPYFARGGLIARHEFPWHVFIEKEQVKEYICGGTLISPTAVLTAAHCIYGSEAEEFRVSIGLYDKRERTAYSVQTRKLSSLIVHPKYNPPEFYSDVGIMILNEKINITDQVRPICLWNEDSNLARVAGTEAVAVGFGLDDNYARPDELQEVRLPIRDHKECYLSNRKFFGKYLVPGDNFCAGYMNGITTCNGDSGGSLSVEKDGRWFIRGIVSFGKSKKVISEEGEERSLCDVNQYTLFADVASYVDWIVENTPEISFRN